MEEEDTRKDKEADLLHVHLCIGKPALIVASRQQNGQPTQRETNHINSPTHAVLQEESKGSGKLHGC